MRSNDAVVVSHILLPRKTGCSVSSHRLLLNALTVRYVHSRHSPL